MTKTDEGYILVSKYEGEEEIGKDEKPEPEKAEPAKVEPEPEPKPVKVEPEPVKVEPEPKPTAKSDDVPEFFKKKDHEKKKPKSESKD